MNADTKKLRLIVQRLLEKGPQPTKLIQEFLEAEGIESRGINFGRAMRAAGATSRKMRGGRFLGFEWFIPEKEQQ